MWPNPLKTADLVTFTDEVLNEKLQFLRSEISNSVPNSPIRLKVSRLYKLNIYLVNNKQWKPN